jgi:nondiscriminating aspartyl-tRNA synthetase
MVEGRSSEHERWLGEWATRTHGSDFLFVVGYPMVKRPFYTHPDQLRPEFSNSFDLLFRGMELVTGGQRLHRYADYLAALAARGLSPEPLAGYLEAFKHGMPPHGGFAIGLERWLARLIGAMNVRETTLFPRDLNLTSVHNLGGGRPIGTEESSKARGERAMAPNFVGQNRIRRPMIEKTL